MQKEKTKRLVLSAVFLALGMVLPLLTGQIKEIGDSLLPMHLVVMLCGLVCGAKYGMAVGALLPFVRSITFGMPPLYPNAIWMSLELLTYGLVIGLIYSRAKKQSTLWLFFSRYSVRIVCSVFRMNPDHFVSFGLHHEFPEFTLSVYMHKHTD